MVECLWNGFQYIRRNGVWFVEEWDMVCGGMGYGLWRNGVWFMEEWDMVCGGMGYGLIKFL